MVVIGKLRKKVNKEEWLRFKMNRFHPEDNRTVFHKIYKSALLSTFFCWTPECRGGVWVSLCDSGALLPGGGARFSHHQIKNPGTFPHWLIFTTSTSPDRGCTMSLAVQARAHLHGQSGALHLNINTFEWGVLEISILWTLAVWLVFRQREDFSPDH